MQAGEIITYLISRKHALLLSVNVGYEANKIENI